MFEVNEHLRVDNRWFKNTLITIKDFVTYRQQRYLTVYQKKMKMAE